MLQLEAAESTDMKLNLIFITLIFIFQSKQSLKLNHIYTVQWTGEVWFPAVCGVKSAPGARKSPAWTLQLYSIPFGLV